LLKRRREEARGYCKVYRCCSLENELRACFPFPESVSRYTRCPLALERVANNLIKHLLARATTSASLPSPYRIYPQLAPSAFVSNSSASPSHRRFRPRFTIPASAASGPRTSLVLVVRAPTVARNRTLQTPLSPSLPRGPVASREDLSRSLFSDLFSAHSRPLGH
jgi:hypothetical protein